MKYLLCNIILLVCYSQLSYTNGPQDVPLSLEKKYLELKAHKNILSSLRDKFRARTLSFKDYPRYERSRDLLRLKFLKCRGALEWLEKGDRMFRALAGQPLGQVSEEQASYINGFIYSVYWTKLDQLVLKCN